MRIYLWKAVFAAAGISILAASPCLSQGAVTPAPEVPWLPGDSNSPRKRMHAIRLNFVKPSVMAWWLDPKNNARPTGAMPEMRFQEMPAGIDRIVAIDPQNSLLVFGTDEGVRRLRNFIQFLDRPSDKIPFRLPSSGQITVSARLLTIETPALNGIWAALATQTGRATPAIAFLKPDEELQMGEQIARREARFERTETRTLNSGTVWILGFGPPLLTDSGRSFFKNFRSDMPVIPPPETGDMKTFGQRNITPRLPSPLGDLKLQIKPTLGTDNAVSLELREGQPEGILGRANLTRFETRAGETLALALPASTPGTNAFLLFTARPSSQLGPLYRTPTPIPPQLEERFRTPPALQPAPQAPSSRVPLLGDLPFIGELFQNRAAPKKSP